MSGYRFAIIGVLTFMMPLAAAVRAGEGGVATGNGPDVIVSDIEGTY
ncbi:MAG: hypothetical protein HYR83_04160, partial [Planctomycetes bacterium]|nr:hypothetical protein [Planctomycetota bacterium]